MGDTFKYSEDLVWRKVEKIKFSNYKSDSTGGGQKAGHGEFRECLKDCFN